MNKKVLIPVILGSSLFVIGSTLFAVGIVTESKNSLVTHTCTLTPSPILDFDIDISTADLEFCVSTDGSKNVVCEEYEDYSHLININGTTLSIRSDIKDEVRTALFSFGFKRQKVKIYLPIMEYNTLNIKDITGNVIIPKEFSFSSLNIEVSSGDVYVKSDVKETINIKSFTGETFLSGCKAKEVNLMTSTGDIKLNNVESTNNILVEGTTSDIEMSNSKAKNLKVNVSTGDVEISNSHVMEKIDIKTSTGDIELEYCDAESLKLETTTGDIEGILLTPKVFNVSSTTGDTSFPFSTEGGLCEIKTSTGDVEFVIKNN